MVWIVRFLLLVTAAIVSSELIIEAKVHNGIPVNTHKYCYAVYILVQIEKSVYNCGSSLINQRILLTAAHCLSSENNLALVSAFAGHYNYKLGHKCTITTTYVHYDYGKTTLANDIALALLEHPLKLDQKLYRIALSTQFYNGYGEIAGWGLINDYFRTATNLLYRTRQSVMNRKECLRIIPNVPDGAICGGKSNDTSYPTKGDSGSALLMFNYLQIGIVSYKMVGRDRSILVYTDVSYFYDWIKNGSERLFCKYRYL